MLHQTFQKSLGMVRMVFQMLLISQKALIMYLNTPWARLGLISGPISSIVEVSAILVVSKSLIKTIFN